MPKPTPAVSNAVAERLVAIAAELSERLRSLCFAPPVTHVYDPLTYARAAHEQYLRRYARPGVEAVLLGMNPGPFGMAQTGVPFGEVGLVAGWLGIDAPIGRPADEHPKRPIEGFACKRSEVSGARLWGWAKERCGSPERFFARFFVLNHCPLVFMERSGRNFTPDKLPRAERDPLLAHCDWALRASIEAIGPKRVVGVGAFAQARAESALAGLAIPTARIPHPSPASPLANRGWAEAADAALAEIGLALG